jgi:hypothetical protein
MAPYKMYMTPYRVYITPYNRKDPLGSQGVLGAIFYSFFLPLIVKVGSRNTIRYYNNRGVSLQQGGVFANKNNKNTTSTGTYY